MSAPKLTFTLVTADGEEQEVTLPARYEVCHRCDGVGTHVNPAIDGNGISPDEFAEDPDFAEAYFAGTYDVRCDTCQGQRVVAVVNDESLTIEQREQYERYQLIEEESARDYASERLLRMMESGERW